MPKVRLLFLLMLIALFGCSEEVDLQPIESDLLLDIREVHTMSDTQPQLVLYLETKEFLPCVNYFLKTDQKFHGGMLLIDLEGVGIGNICFTAMGPATAEIELRESFSKILLKNGDLTDIYDLSVTNEKVEIEAIRTNFSDNVTDSYWRYPEHSFALICGTHPDFPTICDDFELILRDEIPGLQNLAFGPGKIPYPDSSSGNWINHPAKYFTYENETDFDTAGEILKAFSNTYIRPNSGISIWLTNWRNKKHRSWQSDE